MQGGHSKFSLKQKINVKISTEMELVGAHNGMSELLWSNNLIKAQGYMVDNNKLYQNNKSTTLMENIGRASSSKIKNTKARYLFIRYHINQGDMEV